MTKHFYVRPITSKGIVIGYGVYDCVGGMVSEHERVLIDKTRHRRMGGRERRPFLGS